MGEDWIDLLATPLDAARGIHHVMDSQAGGISLFLGTTRAEQHPRFGPLLALDYQAYPEMAMKQLQDLARRARQRAPVLRLALLHRIGRVPISDASVLVAVAAPHRGEAFEISRWLIDSLKVEVAIWKKEIWEGGDETWVHP